MKFSDIVRQLGSLASTHSLSEYPERDPDLIGITPIESALGDTLSYIEGGKFASFVAGTPASALILPDDSHLQAGANAGGIAWIASPAPRLLFAHAIKLFYRPFRPLPFIHATAVVHPSARIGQEVAIGAHAVIEAGVHIGDGACIHPNVVVYPDASIGERTVLHANSTVHERVSIGADCVIHSGAVIGAEGFGFVPVPEGWFKMEQSGTVVLEDGVEIGCNSAVDRPAVGETRIGKNTKIDNLVHIAHNCQIGSACALAGQVGLAGGVKVGDRVILAGQVGIANQARIGDGAIASAKAGIHNDVAPGEVVSGIPAMPHKWFLKVAAAYKRLPDIYQAVKKLPK